MSDVSKSFRTILKHLKGLPSYKVYGDKSFVLLMKDNFHKNKSMTDKGEIKRLRETAMSYAVLVSSTKELKHLRYLDAGASTKGGKNDIELLANRVGFRLPKAYEEGSDTSINQ